jgi:hypothetical protein
MNSKHFLKFSVCPFKGYVASTLRFLEVKAGAFSDRTGGKLG